MAINELIKIVIGLLGGLLLKKSDEINMLNWITKGLRLAWIIYFVIVSIFIFADFHTLGIVAGFYKKWGYGVYITYFGLWSLTLCGCWWLAERIASPFSPFEIIFNPTNPFQQFWCMEPRSPFDDNSPYPCWVYKVNVKNNSSKTVKNVSVTAEYMIEQVPGKKIVEKFDNIKPQCSVFVRIFYWFILPPSADKLVASSVGACGLIKVIARADNILPTIRMFNYDSKKEPMIKEQKNEIHTTDIQ
jgi:hypothetical protein